MEEEERNPYAREAIESLSTNNSAALVKAMLAVAWELRQFRNQIEPLTKVMKIALLEDGYGA